MVFCLNTNVGRLPIVCLPTVQSSHQRGLLVVAALAPIYKLEEYVLVRHDDAYTELKDKMNHYQINQKP